jgi:acetyltransferase-like isoleucine patch superfamily enzyme
MTNTTYFKRYKTKFIEWVTGPRVSNSVLPAGKTSHFIGANAVIDHCVISPFNSIGSNCYLYHCELGSYTYLSSGVSMMNTKVGRFCSIASQVGISLGKHPASKFVSTHPVFFSLNRQCGTTFADKQYFEEMVNTVVGNDVWIGYNAIILDGVVIGDGAIIGAGAVVTKNVPAYAIVAGNPAKIIRYRFTEEEIEFLLKFKWWEKDPVWIEENFKLFHDVNMLMQLHNGGS